MSGPSLGDDHPLFFELKTIRAALARSQEESSASAVKLQHRSFENAQSHERAVYLQQENNRLKAELAVLRATPAHQEPSPESKAHVQELSLSLRRLSLKLTMTEEALLEKTKAVLNTYADLTKAQVARDAANNLTADLRAREELERTKVKDLAFKIRKQEEELRMSDVVIGEYAELVRQLEARPKIGDQAVAQVIHSKISALGSAFSLGRFDLQHVIDAFRSQHDETHQELEKTRAELEIARSQLAARQQAEHALMEDFSLTKSELDKLKINDGTAAKMVARYMQFSQSSANSLFASLDALKARHSATMTTLSSENQDLLTRIHSLELQNEQSRNSLDDLGGELLKEKYGRRREIGLRIRMGGREQRIAEGLRRWVRRSEDAVKSWDRQEVGDKVENQQNNVLLTLSQDARILLDSLEHGGADEETAVSLSGSRARELICVVALLEELRSETERRVVPQISGLDTVEQEDLEAISREYPYHDSQDVSGSSFSVDDQIRDTQADVTMVVTPSSSEVENNGAQLNLSHAEGVVLHVEEDTDTTPEQISTKNHHLEADETASSHHSPPDESLSLEQPSDSSSTQPTMVQQQDSSTSHSASPAKSGFTVVHDQTQPESQQMLHTDVSNPSTSELFMQQEQEPSPHSLLAGLAEVAKRYEVFQREFRDCHLALEGLQRSLGTVSSPQSRTDVFPVELLRPAVARLDDFTEDVRVELEIKIGDDSLLVKGYEALLRVPGALGSYSQHLKIPGNTDRDDPETPFHTDIETQIKAFVDGTDPAVTRTEEMFRTRLEDVQHDIAVLKRAIHDPESFLEELSRSSTSVTSLEQKSNPSAHPFGGGWSSWIRGPSGPTTPTSGFGPSPTFGNIMTSPGLRRSSSQTTNQSYKFTEGEGSRALSILGSFVGLTGKDALPPRDPLSVLGLRVAMPSFNPDGYGIGGNGILSSPTPISATVGGMVSSAYPSSLGIGQSKSRTSSAMYMLGLGSIGGSGRVSRGASINGDTGNGLEVNLEEDAGRTRNDHDVE